MDPLLQCQDDFTARLLADDYLAQVTVLKQRDGVVESDIEVALGTLNTRAGKLGACVVVLMPDLEPKQENVSPPESDLFQPLQVIESPLVNWGDDGTKLSAEQIAARLRRLFHRFYDGSVGTWYLAGDVPVSRNGGQVSRVVRFRRHHQDEALPKVLAPTISIEGSELPYTVTLSCATEGATIRYTFDGSLPTAANEAAQAYIEPFTVEFPLTLRVTASAPEFIDSDVAESAFS